MPSRSSPPSENKSINSTKPSVLMDRFGRLRNHFGRFLWDILGIILMALGFMTLLGIMGLSQGSLMGLWIELLRIGLGWGSIFIVISSLAFGIYAIRRSRRILNVRWEQVISSELAAFLTLALLSLLSGNQLSAAEQGMWGGQIGWSLASLMTKLMPPILAGAVLVFFWILSILTAFGLWTYVERWILQQAGEMLPEGIESVALYSGTTSSLSESPVVSPLPEAGSSYRQANKKGKTLPPEFRKNFTISNQEEKTSSTTQSRSNQLPPLNLLLGEQAARPDERSINQIAGLIEKTLSEFGIPAKVVGFRIGPTVTQFAVQPGFIRKGDEEDAQQMKVRVAQIAGLQKDLSLALSAERLRIEAPVPGRAYVGIEVPNAKSALVRLRPLLETDVFYKILSPLGVALGRDVSGNPVVADLARMPHLLIAGTTGSGKSVCITALATCLAMNNAPEDLRLILIDSKMVELIRYNGLPHLFGKVETDIQRILGVLRWVVVEMEHRYKLLEAAKARDVEAYNRRLQRRKEAQTLPRIVVMIDELADLMMSAPDQTEHNLVRLAQMARATGIHLVVATQRPSTDIVTGLIKANFPARLAFSVASSVDSRVILDLPGAETLLGRGDMLFLNPEVGNPVRAQGVIVTDQEIERLIAYWQKTVPEKAVPPPWETMVSAVEDKSGDDILIERAIILLKKEQRASASMLQRRLNVGYPRAARLLDQLEDMGIVGPSAGGGRDREVLLEPEDDESMVEE
jgi:S-DNA-T family DNA segregation ATPase FtsK/SpoIIIE